MLSLLLLLLLWNGTNPPDDPDFGSNLSCSCRTVESSLLLLLLLLLLIFQFENKLTNQYQNQCKRIHTTRGGCGYGDGSMLSRKPLRGATAWVFSSHRRVHDLEPERISGPSPTRSSRIPSTAPALPCEGENRTNDRTNPVPDIKTLAWRDYFS